MVIQKISHSGFGIQPKTLNGNTMEATCQDGEERLKEMVRNDRNTGRLDRKTRGARWSQFRTDAHEFLALHEGWQRPGAANDVMSKAFSPVDLRETRDRVGGGRGRRAHITQEVRGTPRRRRSCSRLAARDL